MKAFFGFIWRWSIPALWLLSVARAIQGGFERGLEPIETAAKPLVYPWQGVLLVCLWTGLESIILYAILRPQKFNWSLLRIAAALGLFAGISYIHILRMATDMGGYLYMPPLFAFLVTALLAVLFAVAVARAIILGLTSLRSSRHKIT